jgi:hypothetical protein
MVFEKQEDPRAPVQSRLGGEGENLLDTGSAAAVLRCSKALLEKLRCSGAGPEFVKVGSIVRYRHSALMSWVEQNTTRSTAGGRRRRARPVVDSGSPLTSVPPKQLK